MEAVATIDASQTRPADMFEDSSSNKFTRGHRQHLQVHYIYLNGRRFRQMIVWAASIRITSHCVLTTAAQTTQPSTQRTHFYVHNVDPPGHYSAVEKFVPTPRCAPYHTGPQTKNAAISRWVERGKAPTLRRLQGRCTVMYHARTCRP